MKTIKEIQEENRKAIILANNPEAKDYDEAVLLDIGCSEKLAKTRPDLAKDWKGKPLTLDRVLLASKDFGELNEDGCSLHKFGNELHINFDDGNYIVWNLTKETLEEQSEETQRVINKII